MGDERNQSAHREAASTEDRSILGLAARAPDVVWAYGSDPAQVADVYLPDPARSATQQDPRSTVLLVHGGFWRPAYDRAHLRPMAVALAGTGRSVVLVEYRRLPGDPDATMADLRTVLADLPQLPSLQGSGSSPPGWDRPAPTVQLVGHSAGGHLALCLAASGDATIGSCLALAPVADLVLAERLDLGDGAVTDFLGRSAADRPDLDPCQLPRPRIPVRVIHGLADSIVPVQVARSYLSEGTGLLVLPDCAHFEPIDPRSGAWTVVLQELDELDGEAVRA